MNQIKLKKKEKKWEFYNKFEYSIKYIFIIVKHDLFKDIKKIGF